MTAPFGTQLHASMSGFALPFSMPPFPGMPLSLPLLSAGQASSSQRQYIVAPPSLESRRSRASSMRPPAPPPSGPRALSLVAKRKLIGLPEVDEFKDKEIVDAWMTVVDLVVPEIIGSSMNSCLSSGTLFTSPGVSMLLRPPTDNTSHDSAGSLGKGTHNDLQSQSLFERADADCRSTQAEVVKQAAQLEADLAAATAETAPCSIDSTPGQLTGMELLKALAEDQESGRAESSEVQLVTGYAKASVMHRVSETAKANAHSSITGTELQQLKHELPSSDDRIGGSIYLGSIPKGTSEGLIVSECKKFGTVTSIFYDVEDLDILDGGWALVHFTSPECASAAVQRMSRRPGLFGATTPLVVRLSNSDDLALVEARRSSRAIGSEDFAHVAVNKDTIIEIPRAPDTKPIKPSRSHSRPRKHASKKDHTRGKKRDRRRKRKGSSSSDRQKKKTRRDRRRARSRDRSRDRRKKLSSSRSSSKTKSTESASEKMNPHTNADTRSKRGGLSGLKGFDTKASSDTPAVSATASANETLKSIVAPIEEPSGGRQVSIRGTWAEFSTPDSRTYYVNILTLEKQWHRPAGYESTASKRPGAPSSGHSNVYVGNLPLGINEVSFRQLFQQHGSIVSIKLMPSKKSGGNDYGFVKYSSVHEAEAAIKVMNGLDCNGFRLSVKFAMEDKKY